MATKKMSMAQFEKSAIDKKADKKNAKKAGMTVKQWEGSKGDEKADKKLLASVNKKAAKKGK